MQRMREREREREREGVGKRGRGKKRDMIKSAVRGSIALGSN